MGETNNARPHHTKPRFYDLCLMYQLDYEMLQVIADLAKVREIEVSAMFEGHSVERFVAEKVLAVLSQWTGQSFTLDNVDVPLTSPSVEEEHG